MTRDRIEVGILLFAISLVFLSSLSKIGLSDTASQSDAVLSQKIDASLLNKEGETSVIITFDKKPQNYKQLIKSLGGKITHDYGLIDGISVKIDGKDISKLANLESLKRVYVDGKESALLHDSGPLISADKVWSKGITGNGVKVCVVDSGIDYNHPAIDPTCRNQIINGKTNPYVLESPHPYTNNYNNTWAIKMPGYTSISVHFVNISLESGFDYIYIEDSQGNVVDTFTGYMSDRWSKPVQGNTVQINMVSDISNVDYGFYIDKVLNGSVSSGWSNCKKIIGGYDFVNNDEDPYDDFGHGTHVAGIISSNDQYSRGISNGTQLLIAKVLDYDGSGTDSNIIDGIEWCVNNSAKIISMSLGRPSEGAICNDDPVSQAVNNAVDHGTMVVAAAGNDGMNGVAIPACARNAIAVGSIDKNKNVYGSSSKGPELDIVAPGVDINSTVPGGWQSKTGTSMAAPHVTGVIALMMEANPLASIADIRKDLLNSADSVNKCYECAWYMGICWSQNGYATEVPCSSNATGSGIVNASRAVQFISSNDKTPPIITIKSPNSSFNYYKSSVLLNFTSSKPLFKISYSLNKGSNVTIQGPVNMSNSTGLTKGVNNVIVYAIDNSGNIGSSSINFNYCKGDVNGDKKVNTLDLIKVSSVMGKKAGDTGWDSNLDLNNDGVINVLDLIVVSTSINAVC